MFEMRLPDLIEAAVRIADAIGVVHIEDRARTVAGRVDGREQALELV